jgi:hypothetical protein
MPLDPRIGFKFVKKYFYVSFLSSVFKIYKNIKWTPAGRVVVVGKAEDLLLVLQEVVVAFGQEIGRHEVDGIPVRLVLLLDVAGVDFMKQFRPNLRRKLKKRNEVKFLFYGLSVPP